MTALINLALLFGLMQVSQRFKIGENDDVMYVRAGFGLTQLLAFLLLRYVRSKIIAKNDLKSVTYVPLGATAEVTATYRDYDLEQLGLLQKQQVISLVLISALHFYGGYVQPLFLQIFLPWVTLLSHQLIKVHVRGLEATGELQRPWAPPSSGLLDKLKQATGENATTAAAAAAAGTVTAKAKESDNEEVDDDEEAEEEEYDDEVEDKENDVDVERESENIADDMEPRETGSKKSKSEVDADDSAYSSGVNSHSTTGLKRKEIVTATDDATDDEL